MFTRAYPRNKLPYCLEKAEMPTKKESASCGKTNKYYNCNKYSNDKLIERGIRMIRASIAISEKEARDMLLKYGSVQKVLESFPT